MGYSREHFIYALQATGGNLTTFNTTPASYYEIPAVSHQILGNYEFSEERILGGQRGVTGRALGAIAPSGTLETDMYVENMLQLFLTFMRDSIKQDDAPSVGNYTYGMLYDDTLDLLYFSAQQIYKNTVQYPTDALGLSVLAGIVNSWTLTANQGEKVKLSLEYLAKDRAVSTDDSSTDNKYWHYDETENTPNIIDVTSITAAPSERSLWFFDGGFVYDSDGGSTFEIDPATNVTSFTTTDTLANIESFSIAVAHNVDAEGYDVGATDKTRTNFCPGNRDITITATINWCDRSITLYELAEAGEPVPMKLSLAKSTTRKIDLYFPAVFIQPFELPAISGDKTKRTIEITGTAEMKTVDNTTTGTTDYDMNIVWICDEAITPA